MTILIRPPVATILGAAGLLRRGSGRGYRVLKDYLAPTGPIRVRSRQGPGAACACAGSEPGGFEAVRTDPRPGPDAARAEGHLSVVLLNRLVRTHVKTRDFLAAEAEARWALELSREVVGANHPAHATCVNNLGLLLIRRGDLGGAEAILRQALASYRESPEGPGRAQAVSLMVLGLVHERRGEFSWARTLYREGLDAYKALDRGDHPDYADGLIALARVLWKQGDWERAALHVSEAREIQARVLGDRHPSYAATLTVLGCLCRNRGDLRGAETHLRDAMDVRRGVLGERHPAYATSLHHLGLVLYEAGDPVNAEAALRTALEIRRDSLGGRHALTALTEHHLERAAARKALDARETSAFDEEVAGGFPAGDAREGPRGRVESPADSVLPPPFTDRGPVLARGADSLLGTARPGKRCDESEAVRRKALGVLSRVLALSHRDDQRSEPLRDCRARAAALHAAIVGSESGVPHPDAARLASGDHPLADLVTFVERQKEVDNFTWARLHESVEAEFGKPLAMDVARGRISRSS